MKEGGLRVPATNSSHFALLAFLFMVLWHLHPPNKDVKGYTLTCWAAMSGVSFSLLQWYWSSDLEWLVVALVVALIASLKAISRSYYIYIVLTAPTPRDHHAKLKCSYNATIMFLYNFESWSEGASLKLNYFLRVPRASSLVKALFSWSQKKPGSFAVLTFDCFVSCNL